MMANGVTGSPSWLATEGQWIPYSFKRAKIATPIISEG